MRLIGKQKWVSSQFINENYKLDEKRKHIGVYLKVCLVWYCYCLFLNLLLCFQLYSASGFGLDPGLVHLEIREASMEIDANVLSRLYSSSKRPG